jgi:ribosomal protein S14
MVKTFNTNKEINKKLLKYMILHLANKPLHFPCIEKYISTSVQEELTKLKLYLLTPEKINEYKNKIIPTSLSVPIKQKLEYEINKFIKQKGQYDRKQYIMLLYRCNNLKIRNICFLSGRSRAVYRVFHLSRLKIREHAQFGQFIGFKKIS